MSSSGSGAFSSWVTTENHCLKPHAAPGHGTAPACTNTSSASIRKQQRLSLGFKFSLVKTQGLLLTLQLTETYPARRDPQVTLFNHCYPTGRALVLVLMVLIHGEQQKPARVLTSDGRG